MSDKNTKQDVPVSSPPPEQDDFARGISIKALRKLKARSNGSPGVWFGLGMMGLIGWSVVVPTLLGASIGIWLDEHYPASYSWTLALLMGGLTLGCFNAWHWIDKEAENLREDEKNDGDN